LEDLCISGCACLDIKCQTTVDISTENLKSTEKLESTLSTYVI